MRHHIPQPMRPATPQQLQLATHRQHVAYVAGQLSPCAVCRSLASEPEADGSVVC